MGRRRHAAAVVPACSSWPCTCAVLSLYKVAESFVSTLLRNAQVHGLQQRAMLCEPCATPLRHGHTKRSVCASAATHEKLAAPVYALPSHEKCAAATTSLQQCTACNNTHSAAHFRIKTTSTVLSQHIRCCAASSALCCSRACAQRAMRINPHMHLAALHASVCGTCCRCSTPLHAFAVAH